MPEHPMRILIVDDDKTNRRLMARMLGRMGYTQVEEAGDGLACLEQVAAGFYPLIFLDISMPGIDGLETCERIRNMQTALHPRSWIVACTAHAGQSGQTALRQRGFDDVLTKPFLSLQLEAAINGAPRPTKEL